MSDQNTAPKDMAIDQEGFSDKILNIENIHINTAQNIIVTTEDKLRLHLLDHLNIMERKKEWITPLSILLTIIAVLITANFKDFLLKSETWKLVFIIGGVASFVWLVKSLNAAFKKYNIEDFIEELKCMKSQYNKANSADAKSRAAD